MVERDANVTLQAVKDLLRRYIAQRAGEEPSGLAQDLREAHDFLVAEAARRGITLEQAVRAYRDSLSKVGARRDEPAGDDESTDHPTRTPGH